jgi:hypothetical protein
MASRRDRCVTESWVHGLRPAGSKEDMRVVREADPATEAPGTTKASEEAYVRTS